tara:strand:- start:112 stop:429 length:318 start_codon:yes stop_codon:yes gene_type:complete
MKLVKKDSYFFLSEFEPFNETEFLEKLDVLKKDPSNLIIEFKTKLINKNSLILSLVKYASFWKNSDKSFILVVGDFVLQNEDLTCVPTLDEAIDYLYMEELERNV